MSDGNREEPGGAHEEIVNADAESAASNPYSTNPYSTPADAPAPIAAEPSVALWVAGFATLGAVVMAVVELSGRMPLLTVALPTGVGGASIGALIGALCGRVVGRLLVARHRFRAMAHRRHELNEELLERRRQK